MDEKQRKRALRIDIGSYGWAMLIYYFLMNACVAVAMMLEMVWRMSRQMSEGDFSGTWAMDVNALAGNGWGYLLACVLAVLFIRIWKGREFFSGMWKTDQNMIPGTFWRLLCLFISGQLLFQICAAIQESVLNIFGLSVLEPMALATGHSDTFSMFLYTGLAAPVVEEIIFRGLVMRGLEKYGKRFAVLISAILFGLFHGNIVQSPYAFAVGLVLGYTAMEYNILWAMVLHMANNLVLGDTIVRLTQGLGEIFSALVVQGLILVCTAAAAVSLIRRRKQVLRYHRAEPLDWSCWWAFCTAPGMIVMFILMELNALSMLFL